MKPILITLTAALLAAAALHAQEPDTSPSATASPTASAPLAPTTPPAPSASIPAHSGNFSFDADLDAKLDKLGKGLTFNFDSSGKGKGKGGKGDENEQMALAVVAIVFLSLFGCPVLIVGLLLFSNYWKTRSLHRTVRLMVEKGVEVPPALLAPPDRPRSDSRRGVILSMTGLGLILFFAARHGFQGGSWSIGVIPFMIGLGYLLVARLDRPKANQLPPV